jgi:ribosomal protein L10
MGKVVKSEKRIKKEKYWFRLQELAQKYKNVCFIDANNVSSKQICMIRAKLRGIDAHMIMGKNVSRFDLECLINNHALYVFRL